MVTPRALQVRPAQGMVQRGVGSNPRSDRGAEGVRTAAPEDHPKPGVLARLVAVGRAREQSFGQKPREPYAPRSLRASRLTALRTVPSPRPPSARACRPPMNTTASVLPCHPQLPPIHLPQVSAREVVEEHHLPRRLVGLQPLPDERLELLTQASRLLLRDDEGVRLGEALRHRPRRPPPPPSRPGAAAGSSRPPAAPASLPPTLSMSSPRPQ